MRIGAYQFSVTGDVNSNFSKIKYAVNEAKEKQIDLLVFPECALQGIRPEILRIQQKSILPNWISYIMSCNRAVIY